MPPGIPVAIPSAAATMRTASEVSCTEGEMCSAAHAAPIPEPTAAPIDQAACIIGMTVRPSAPSTAEPSTLMSTSRRPMPAPARTKTIASTGTEPAASARPMALIAAAMSTSAPTIALRLPAQCRTGVEASNPSMAPTVTPASSRPMVAVLMPRPDLIAGSRGPHAEMAIPPSQNVAVMVHRQRVRTWPSGMAEPSGAFGGIRASIGSSNEKRDSRD